MWWCYKIIFGGKNLIWGQVERDTDTDEYSLLLLKITKVASFLHLFLHIEPPYSCDYCVAHDTHPSFAENVDENLSSINNDERDIFNDIENRDLRSVVHNNKPTP